MDQLRSLDQAKRVIRGMVTPHERIRLSRCVSHDPLLFFAEVFNRPVTCGLPRREGDTSERVSLNYGVSSLAPHIHLIKSSRRQLVVPHKSSHWEALVSRRINRGARFVKTILDEAYIEGYPGFQEEEIVRMVLRWTLMDWVGVSVKQMKLHSVWLSGYSRDVDCPQTGMLDTAGYLGSARYRTWLLRKLRDRRVRRDCPYSPAMILGESWLLGVKRGAPSMEKEDTELAVTDYLKQMSERHDISGQFREAIIEALITTTREVFGTTDKVEVTPFTPSQRAGYEAAIWTGGILGDMIRAKPELLEERQDIEAIWDGINKVTVSARRFREDISFEYLDKMWLEDQLADCQIYMIYEPLKLRTISAGTPVLYGNMQPILDHMRAGMRKFEVFRLTREENNAAWLSSRLNAGPKKMLRQFRLINSGDYQQSTNDLFMEATDIVRWAAFENGQQRLSTLVKAALGAQVLHWRPGMDVQQRRGQLMGSPLSFPVLCVINAALMRLAYQIAYNRWWDKPLDFFPMAINGDDIVSRLDLRVYDVWIQLLSAVGWKLSPGKAYLHETLAQVNSQTMPVSWANRGTNEEKLVLENPIPYINHGFVSQMGKATTPVDDTPLDAMSMDWQKRFASFERLPSGMKARAEQVMLRNLRSVAHDLHSAGWVPFVIEPFNPVYLGGFGLSDSVVSLEAAWAGLNSRKRRKITFEEKLRKNPGLDSPPEPEPYLTLVGRGHRAPREGEFLDALVDDLECYVDTLMRWDPTAPAGHVDPELKREPMTLVDVALFRLNADREVLVQA